MLDSAKNCEEDDDDYIKPLRVKPDYIFQNSYAKTSNLGRWFVRYGDAIVNAVGKNQGQIPPNAVEDLKMKPDEDAYYVEAMKKAIRES